MAAQVQVVCDISDGPASVGKRADRNNSDNYKYTMVNREVAKPGRLSTHKSTVMKFFSQALNIFFLVIFCGVTVISCRKNEVSPRSIVVSTINSGGITNAGQSPGSPIINDIGNIAGILTGIVSLISYIPYIVSILKKKTTPNRATWFIWLMSAVIIYYNYAASGANYQQLFLPLSYVIGEGIVAFLSIKFGEGGWSPLDRFSIICAAIMLLLSFYFDDPAIVFMVYVLFDFFGTIPTLKKSFKRPWSENKFAWLLVFIASTSNLFTISSIGFVLLLYPLYTFITNGCIAAFVLNFQRMEKTPVNR